MRRRYEFNYRVVNSFGVPLRVVGMLRASNDDDAQAAAERRAFAKCATHNLPTPERMWVRRIGVVETIFR